MKIDNKWIVLSFIALTTLPIHAQQEKADTTYVERDVKIEKEYQPEVFESRRLSVDLPTTEVPATKTDVVFSNYNQPLSLITPFVPTTQADMTFMNREDSKLGYARVGIGLPLMWLGDLWYPLVEKRNDSFSVGLNHNGLCGKNQKNIVTDLGFTYQHRFDGYNFNAKAGYGNHFFNYYGIDSLNPGRTYIINKDLILPGDSIFNHDNEFIHRANVSFGIASTAGSDSWNYAFDMGYVMNYLQQAEIGEHNLLIAAEAEGPIGEHKLRIGVDINTLFYSTNESALLEKKQTNAVFALKPAYLLQWKEIMLQLGVKLYCSTSTGRIINLMPDVKGVFNFKESIQLYAGIGGDYKVNSLTSLLGANRFYNPYLATIKNSYSPFDVYLGVNIKPIRGMVIDACIDYNYTYDNYYFSNQSYNYMINQNGQDTLISNSSNRFKATNIDLSELSFNLRLSYNHKEMYRVYVAGKFNDYFKKDINNFQMPYQPIFELDLGAEVRALKNLVIHGNFAYASARNIGLSSTELKSSEKLSPIYNLNLGAHYSLPKNITLFVRTNNWLSLVPSLRYKDWNGYDNIGFNGLIGASFAF